jgi:phosphatidate cytidylyltransferase
MLMQWSTLFMQVPYFICPCRDLGMTALSAIHCDPNPVFLWRDLALPAPLASSLSSLVRFPVFYD